jgi:hypothetical protein
MSWPILRVCPTLLGRAERKNEITSFEIVGPRIRIESLPNDSQMRYHCSDSLSFYPVILFLEQSLCTEFVTFVLTLVVL